MAGGPWMLASWMVMVELLMGSAGSLGGLGRLAYFIPGRALVASDGGAGKALMFANGRDGIEGRWSERGSGGMWYSGTVRDGNGGGRKMMAGRSN